MKSLAEWIRADRAVIAMRKLPPVTVPNIMLSPTGTKYDTKLTFDWYLLIANGTPNLMLAAERRAALSRIKDIWMEKKPSPLTVEDLMAGIRCEPTMRIRMVFKKRINRKQILTPVMSNMKTAVKYLSLLIKEMSGTDTRASMDRVDKLVQEAHQQTEKDKTEALAFERDVVLALDRELEARATA